MLKEALRDEPHDYCNEHPRQERYPLCPGRNHLTSQQSTLSHLIHTDERLRSVVPSPVRLGEERRFRLVRIDLKHARLHRYGSTRKSARTDQCRIERIVEVCIRRVAHALDAVSVVHSLAVLPGGALLLRDVLVEGERQFGVDEGFEERGRKVHSG